MSLLPVNARKGERFPSGAKVLLFPSSSALDPLQGYLPSKGHVQPQRFLLLLTSWKSWPPSEIATFLCSNSSVWKKGARGKKWRCYPCNNISQLISNFHLDVLGRCCALCCGGQQPAALQELFAWRTDIPGTFYLQVVSENSQVEVISCSDGRSAVDTSRGQFPPPKISVSAPSACWPNNAQTVKV